MKGLKTRVRFAPSPTGPLHIGGVRTALFNYLFAKRNNGDFILRIEDTDQKRYVDGAEEYILKSLKWCGLKYDEGIDVEGEFGPYRQSERMHLYKQFALSLIEDGHAYYAFDTPEELEEMREKMATQKGANPQYDANTRMSMRNSLTLTEDETQNLIDMEEPYVIRFKMPEEDEDVVIDDLIRGEVIFNTSVLDDKVLFKSDGLPTYHLANVVDDYLMHISHVIRGEEWLSSTPLHYLIYRALGWEKHMPEFAHLPLILKPNGKGKLSKRDGDNGGFPVFPLEWTDPSSGEVFMGYRESGYLPEAFLNMLVMLGWNPGDDKEIISMDELMKTFSLERIQKSGAKFDPEKAKWYNHKYLQEKSPNELAKHFIPVLEQKNIDYDPAKTRRVVELVKERLNFVHELWDQAYFFFEAPKSYDEKVIKKRWKEGTGEKLMAVAKEIEKLVDFNAENGKETCMNLIQQNEWNTGQIMNCLRLCLVGAGMGPDLFTIAEIIGKEEFVRRIEKGVEEIEIR